MFDEILQRYRRLNKNISITYVDHMHIHFSTKYTKDGGNLREGSYIVESDERLR